MKLINCYIENFGKLSNYKFDFNDGINIICEENGWGKSTLAAFIKIMFYGFENERARKDEASNERKRYKPWQGGTYGGRLTFEVNGKSYEMTRIFGTKDKEDVFELRDVKTNLIVNDYSTNIGEELFEIDGASFARTIYISQNSCETSATGNINAKIGNLAENTDDINNYESVNKALTDIINGMTPNRKTGELYKLKEEITRITMAVREGEEIKNSISLMKEKKVNKKSEYEAVNKESDELLKEIEKISAKKDLRIIKEKYNDIIENLNRRQAEVTELEKQYTGIIPDMEILDEKIKLCKQYEELLQKLEYFEMTEEEDVRFNALNQIECITEYAEETHEESIKAWDKHSELQKKLVINEAKLEAKNEIKNTKKQKNDNSNDTNDGFNNVSSKINSPITKIVSGIILMIIGIVLLFSNTAIGAMGIIMGIVFVVTGFIDKTKNKINKDNDTNSNMKKLNDSTSNLKSQQKNTESEYDEARNSGFDNEETKNELEDEIIILENSIQYMKEQIAKIEEKVIAYISVFFDEEISLDKFNEYMRRIEKLHSEYQRLVSKHKSFTILSSETEKVKNDILEFYDEYSLVVEGNMYEQLTKLQKYLINYDNANKLLQEAMSAKKKYELENDNLVEALNLEYEENNDGESSVAELTNKQKDLADKLIEIRKSISDYERQISDLEEKYDLISGWENELSGIKQRYEEGMRKYNNLSKTKEYMEKAKESLTTKYMQPIMNAFWKYISILSKENDNKYRINSQAEVTVEEKGMQRSIKFLSEGYKDMIGVCMRMALVDAMYQEEKPFIIFDDPFVNLDDVRIEGGMEFLRKVSVEYQMIYFTCHSSRK